MHGRLEEGRARPLLDDRKKKKSRNFGRSNVLLRRAHHRGEAKTGSLIFQLSYGRVQAHGLLLKKIGQTITFPEGHLSLSLRVWGAIEQGGKIHRGCTFGSFVPPGTGGEREKRVGARQVRIFYS
jgi:hypothetical protein